MNNSNVVIPTEGRDLLKVSEKFGRTHPSTCTTIGSVSSLIKLLMTLVLLLTSAASGFTQSITPEVVSSGGGDSTNANAGLSWTVGEPVSETKTGANATVTQGFHQSHFEIISIEEHAELGYDISVYPNPATDHITVELKFTGNQPAPDKTKFKIVLTDIAGKALWKKGIKNQLQCEVPMQGFAEGQYILQISGAGGVLYESAKIIKLN